MWYSPLFWFSFGVAWKPPRYCKTHFGFLTWIWFRMQWAQVCILSYEHCYCNWPEPMDPLEINGSYMMNKSFEDAYSLNKIIPVYRVHVVCDVCYMSHLVERCVWTSFRPPQGFLSTVTTVTLTRRRQAIQSQDTAFPHERASVMNAVGLVMDIMHFCAPIYLVIYWIVLSNGIQCFCALEAVVSWAGGGLNILLKDTGRIQALGFEPKKWQICRSLTAKNLSKDVLAILQTTLKVHCVIVSPN